MDSGLANRAVMVTGASGGIGQEIARAFAAEGARVLAHYGTGVERARGLAAELGPSCVAVGAELTCEQQVEHLFAEAEKAFGPVEILIANAGLWPSENTPLHSMTLGRWESTLAVNLTSVFLCVREFFKGIVRHHLTDPAAVLMGSTAAIFGEAGHADYAAAKAALAFGLARSLKNELCLLAPSGRINVVCPGWTITPLTKRFTDDPSRVRRVLQTIPLRELGTPSDVAAAVVYLASSRLAGHITGQVLTLAGGMEGRVLYREDEIDVAKE